MNIESDTPRTVDLAAIERELHRLWVAPPGGGQPTVTRACMSNLIIFCATAEQGRAAADVGAIVQQHPSRVLLLVSDPADSGAGEITAYVSAHCHLGGDKGQICSEHITVNATGGTVRRLPSVARSLLIGDLPTALWWAVPDAPPLGGELFSDLSSMAEHVIYDSLGWREPGRSVIATAAWAAGDDSGPSLSDLAWRRLKPWRRFIAQCLDPAVLPGALGGITDITVEHGPSALLQAWLLVGWLASCLHWRPRAAGIAPRAELGWTFDAPRGSVRVTARQLDEDSAELSRLAITTTTSGGSLEVNFRMHGGRLVMTAEGARTLSRVLPAPELPRAHLVARQLPKRGRDAVYREVLKVSKDMAEAVWH